MAGVRVHVVMPLDLVARVDAARPSGVSRGEFVRSAVLVVLGELDAVPALGAVEQALGDARERREGMQAGPGSVSSAGGVRPAAPAEQSGEVERAVESARRQAEASAAQMPRWWDPDDSPESPGFVREVDGVAYGADEFVLRESAEVSEVERRVADAVDRFSADPEVQAIRRGGVPRSGLAKRGVGPVPKKSEGKR